MRFQIQNKQLNTKTKTNHVQIVLYDVTDGQRSLPPENWRVVLRAPGHHDAGGASELAEFYHVVVTRDVIPGSPAVEKIVRFIN